MIDATHLGQKNIFEIKKDGVYNIYVVQHEYMKLGDWGMRFKTDIDSFELDKIITSEGVKLSGYYPSEVYKIVATTDDQLIADGVQALGKDFLDWLNKNKANRVGVRDMTDLCGDSYQNSVHCGCETPEYCEETYRLFYPKPEKPKPPVEQTYSQKEVIKLILEATTRFGGSSLEDYVYESEVLEWFEKNSSNKNKKIK
jgi:hypothetical protein